MKESVRKLTPQPKRSIFIAQIFEGNELEDRKEQSKENKKKSSMLNLSPNYLEGRKESKFSKSFFLSNLFGENQNEQEKGEKVKSKKSNILAVPDFKSEECITKEPLKRTPKINSSSFVANIVDENGIEIDVNEIANEDETTRRTSRRPSNSSNISNNCLAPGKHIFIATKVYI